MNGHILDRCEASFCWLETSADTTASVHLFVKHAETPTFEKHICTPMLALIFLPALDPCRVNEKIAGNDSGLPSICTHIFHGMTV